MVFIETPLDAAHEAKAFWVKPPKALMLASFKVSVSQVVIVPFVTAFGLSHSTEAHHIPVMAFDELTPHDNHQSLAEEEEAPSPGSPTDSWQADPSSVLSLRLAETISGPVSRRCRTRRIKPREKLRPRGLRLRKKARLHLC